MQVIRKEESLDVAREAESSMKHAGRALIGRALIGLGANLPFRGLAGPALLEAALSAIEAAELPVIAVSSAWASAAWPDPSQPAFTNAVAALETGDMRPDAVYAILAGVETRFGRDRAERFAPRTLDLDLLDLNGLVGDYGGVIIPHERMADRCFVLAPLQEIDPEWVHPGLNVGVAALLKHARIGEGLQRIGPLRIAPGGSAD
jgi:2-amino-4-hydroxy-6-hydroxymethyldihydropteridine diphosphokinase